MLGASLGLVYTPCAGPILAGVITVSASQDFTAGKLAVALAYAIGSGAVLYLLMLGGRRVADRMKPWRAWIQAGTGAVMVLLALAMTADLDIKFQNAIASDLPSFLVNPSGDLEDSGAVSDDLAALRGGGQPAAEEGGAEEAKAGLDLPDYGPAPDFVAPGEWFNTDGEPLSIDQLTDDEGRVVLVDFWTYTCINCIRTLPYLKAWDAEYRDRGLTVVGVHAPEFAFERDAGNVADAIDRNGIEYPVVQDNEFGTWTAFGNQYWPAKYLIDADGEVRYVHFGEGGYEETEAAIRSLLAEAGDAGLGARRRASGRRDRRPRPRHPGDVPRHGARPGLGRSAAGRRARLRSAGPGRAGAERVRLRRPVVDRSRVGHRGRRRDRERPVPGAARVPGPRIGGRRAARRSASSSTASRSPTPTPARTFGRRGDDREPAPLPARRPAGGRRPRPHAQLRPGHLGLRVHVRLAPQASRTGAP